MKRVVITGMGAITPLGNTVEAYKQGLFAGKSGAGDITRFDAEHFKTRFACEVDNYNADEVFGRREARRLDRFSQFALIAAREAVAHSGLDIEKADKEDIGVIWGSGIGGLRSLEKEIESQRPERPRYNPFMIPKMISDIAPGNISIEFGFKGINYGTVSACASAAHAIINATDYIRLGRAKAILCGGSEAAITKAGVGGFSSMKALSERNDDPGAASRPFDVNRDGFVLGEGAGALFLEEHDHAVARGAHILAEVVGVGMTADAYHITAPDPSGKGIIRVMQKAVEDSGLAYDEIDYINVHGTSTQLGDIAEANAIKEVFGESAYDLNISSTKSMTGHLLGAAGAVESIAGILAIRENIVPPTINFEELDPEIDEKLNFTFNKAQEREVRAIMSNTFGFGGHNASVVFKSYK